MRCLPGFRIAIALLAAAAWTAGVAMAASPPGLPAGVQVYLDADTITPDAPPGGVVQVGYTFWNGETHAFAATDGVYVLLHPKTGHAPASNGKIDADFPGHVLATIAVPNGGPGKLEIGIRSGGANHPITVAGTGPPPDLPASELYTATIEPLVGDTVVDRPFTAHVDLNTRGLWAFGDLQLPDHVVIVARHPGGPDLSTANLPAPAQAGTPYTGKLTVPETGDIELAVRVPGPSGDVEVNGSTLARTVIEAGRRDSAAPSATTEGAPVPTTAEPLPAPAGPDGLSLVIWIAIGATVVLVGVLLIRKLGDL